MFEFVTAGPNMPFAIALTVMVGIALLEGVALLLGAGLSHFLDALLPGHDFDFHTDFHGDIDASEVPAVAPLSRFLGWLRVGKVPILILLVIFLTAFGLIGLGIQTFVNNSLGFLLPGIVAAPISIALTLPVVRVVGGGLEKIMPKDETSAVSESSLVGRIATITIGTAKKGSPAEAKVRDQHGLTHYVMLEPDEEGVIFESGSSVLLIRYEGNVYGAIENTNKTLVED